MRSTGLETGLMKGTGKVFASVRTGKSIVFEALQGVLFVKELDGEGTLLYDKVKQYFISGTSFNKIISFS